MPFYAWSMAGPKWDWRCSFCGKSQDQVRRLVAGPGVFICDECVELCNEVIYEEPPAGSQSQTSAGWDPQHKRAGRRQSGLSGWLRRLLRASAAEPA